MTLYEISERLKYITDEISKLSDEISLYNKDDKEKSYLDVQDLRAKTSKFVISIQSVLWKQTNQDIIEQMKEFKKRAKNLRCFDNPYTLADELTKLRIEWKNYMRETQEVRKQTEKQKNNT